VFCFPTPKPKPVEDCVDVNSVSGKMEEEAAPICLKPNRRLPFVLLPRTKFPLLVRYPQAFTL
jgi:hypothetical protein